MSEPQEEAVGGKGFALVYAFLTACLLDQSVKLWVEEHASSLAGEGGGRSLVLLSYAENSSALWGWTAGWPEPLRLVLFSLAALLALSLAWLIFRSLAPGEWLSASALGLFVGGAASNLLDRFRLGASLDVFRMPFPADLGEYAPVFNPADFCIVVGGIILLLELWVHEGRERAATIQPPED